jgi:hypothetical protein
MLRQQLAAAMLLRMAQVCVTSVVLLGAALFEAVPAARGCHGFQRCDEVQDSFGGVLDNSGGLA